MSRPPRSPPRKPSEINKKAIPRVHYPKLNTSITRKAYVYYEPELPLPRHIGRFEIYDYPELPQYERFDVTESIALPRYANIGIDVTHSPELPRKESPELPRKESPELPRTHNIGRFYITESPELPRTHNIGRFQILEPAELAGRKSKARGSKRCWYKEKPNYHKRTVMLRKKSNRLRHVK